MCSVRTPPIGRLTTRRSALCGRPLCPHARHCTRTDVGVHENMCIMGRPFAIEKLRALGWEASRVGVVR